MGFYDTCLAGKQHGINLCVGLDPSLQILSRWGLENSPDGVFDIRSDDA